MTTPEDPVMRIATPAELLSAMPYLLGFHPDNESLVVVGVDDVGVTVTVQIGVAQTYSPAAMSNLFSLVSRGQSTGVVAIFYTDTLTRERPTAVPLADSVPDSKSRKRLSLRDFVMPNLGHLPEGERSTWPLLVPRVTPA